MSSGVKRDYQAERRRRRERDHRQVVAEWVQRNYAPVPPEPAPELMSDLRLLLALVGQAFTDVAS